MNSAVSSHFLALNFPMFNLALSYFTPNSSCLHGQSHQGHQGHDQGHAQGYECLGHGLGPKGPHQGHFG